MRATICETFTFTVYSLQTDTEVGLACSSPVFDLTEMMVMDTCICETEELKDDHDATLSVR